MYIFEYPFRSFTWESQISYVIIRDVKTKWSQRKDIKRNRILIKQPPNCGDKLCLPWEVQSFNLINAHCSIARCFNVVNMIRFNAIFKKHSNKIQLFLYFKKYDLYMFLTSYDKIIVIGTCILFIFEGLLIPALAKCSSCYSLVTSINFEIRKSLINK